MIFSQIIGQEHIKNHLQKSIESGRIPHAQLFIGKEGSGTLPMAVAYAQSLICDSSNNIDACHIKCHKLQHPDLHFAFPVSSNEKIKKHPISNLFHEDWRTFIDAQPYGSLFNWLQHIGIQNKQGFIGVDEAEDIVKKLQLKAYEGGRKVLIMWMAEKMNIAAANKLLKLIEEPPKNTVFILIAENEEQIIKTIKSRCQTLYFPVLTEKEIVDALISREKCPKNTATITAQRSEGNYNKATRLLHNNSDDLIFEKWFVEWIRNAFRARGNATVIQQLVVWSDTISKTGRETQKRFLEYCLYFFRQAMLLNYKSDNLVFLEPKTGFSLSKFAPFVHSNNILEIEAALSKAIYHIERNGNARIILLDVSIKLTRFLHKKEAAI